MCWSILVWSTFYTLSLLFPLCITLAFALYYIEQFFVTFLFIEQRFVSILIWHLILHFELFFIKYTFSTKNVKQCVLNDVWSVTYFKIFLKQNSRLALLFFVSFARKEPWRWKKRFEKPTIVFSWNLGSQVILKTENRNFLNVAK